MDESSLIDLSLKEMEINAEEDKVVKTAAKVFISRNISKIMRENNIEAATKPFIKTIHIHPLLFELVIPLKPTIQLGDYYSMKVDPEPLVVKEKEVDEILEQLREMFIKYEPVVHTALAGDASTIDIEGTVSGAQFICKNDVKFIIKSNFANDIPGLCERIIGLQNGEEKEFQLILPQNFINKSVAGQEASFKVKMHNIERIVFPEVNDEFAKKIAPGVQTIDSLRERIKKNIQIERERNAESKYEEKVVEALIQISRIEYAPIMVDMEAEEIVTDYKRQMRDSCNNEDAFQEKWSEVSDNVLKERALSIAQKKILWSLVIDKLAITENIGVELIEIDEEIERMVEGVGEESSIQRDYLNEEQSRQNIYELNKAKKAIRRLVQIVGNNNNIN
jgi:trigger factor